MQNKFILFLICFIPLSVSANFECGFNPTSVDALFDFYKTNCSDQGPIPLCDCLKTQSASNAFIQDLFKDQKDLKVKKEDYVVSQTQRLLSMYSQMTYGDAYQKKILGLEDKIVVGCSSDDIAKYFKAGLKDQMEHDTSKHSENSADNRATLARINDKANQKCDELGRIIRENVLVGTGNSTKTGLIRDLQEARIYFEKNGKKDMANEAGAAIDKLSHSNGSEQFLNIGFTFTKPKIPKEIKLDENHLFIPEDTNSSKERDVCLVESGEYKGVMANYYAELSRDKDSSPPVRDLKDPFQGLIKQIDTLNAKVSHDLARSYDNVLPDACYTFSEYKVLSSMPSKELINALIQTPIEERNNFLVPQHDIRSALEVQKLKFLKANPVLANTQTVACAQNEVPGLLYDFAIQTQGKSDAEKAKAYINFMKGPSIRSLLNASEVKMGAVQNCNTLGRNLAAVLMTDEPGPVPSFNTSNPLDMLRQQVLKCKIDDKHSASTSNLEATLNANPLYLLSDDNIGVNTSSSEDEDYRKFLVDNCAGYEGHRQKFMDVACGHTEDKSGCLKNLGSTAGSKAMRESYFDGSASPSVKEINKVVHENTNTLLSPSDHKSVARVNRDDAQDKATRKKYIKEVLPKLGHTVLASRGQEKAFADEQEQTKKVIAAATTPATVAPAQIAEPDWSKAPMPVITPTTLASAKAADHLPVTYKDEAPEKQLQTIEEARENLVTAGEKLVKETKDPSEKDKIIADLRASIENMDKEAAKVEKLVTPSVPVATSNVASTSSGTTSDQPVTQTTGGGSGSFSSGGNFQSAGAASAYVKSRESGDDKTSEALLKTKYLDSEKSTGRSPASVESDNAKIVIGMPMVQPLPADAEVLSHLALDATSFGDKSLIMDKVKAELAKNKIQPNEKVLIQFYDQEKKQVMIVSVAWANNQWVISQVPRKSLLSNLNLTLIGQSNL